MTEFILFIRAAMANPRSVGSLFPSSKTLARKIALELSKDTQPGIVIELGAGTGSITHALLNSTVPSRDIRVVECSDKLARHLQVRFPKLHIIHGDAMNLSHLLEKETAPIKAIISGLPLRCLPDHVVHTVGSEVNKLLRKGGLLIQYTYSLCGRPISPSPQLKHLYSKHIWRNVPPARIDVFRF